MPVTTDPQEVPPAQPASPAMPSVEIPPGSTVPDISPPMREPGGAVIPEELPGRTPDEAPVRGPQGPRTPYPVSDTRIDDQPGSEPDVVSGIPKTQGTM